MNKLFLIGNLTKDPETRTTPNGKTVCNFDIAVNDRQGNATYFRVSAWEKQGENCQRYLSKGKKVSVIGPVSARAYTDRNGNANVSIEVSAQDVEFLSPRDSEASYQQQERQAIQREGIPAGAIAVEMEDIPF
jgi:single-strand DNA-binding protein